MPDPLQTSQQRWEQFFAQQGRQMPQAGRPAPPAAAPAAAPAGAFPGRPFLSNLAARETAPGGFFKNMLWKAARAKAAQQQPAPQAAQGQGIQQFGAAMPFQGGGGSFFRRKGV
jgi:hypothetical protein